MKPQNPKYQQPTNSESDQVFKKKVRKNYRNKHMEWIGHSKKDFIDQSFGKLRNKQTMGFSKTDDLKFLKDMSKKNSRRGSSAVYQEEQKRVEIDINSKIKGVWSNQTSLNKHISNSLVNQQVSVNVSNKSPNMKFLKQNRKEDVVTVKEDDQGKKERAKSIESHPTYYSKQNSNYYKYLNDLKREDAPNRNLSDSLGQFRNK